MESAMFAPERAEPPTRLISNGLGECEICQRACEADVIRNTNSKICRRQCAGVCGWWTAAPDEDVSRSRVVPKQVIVEDVEALAAALREPGTRYAPAERVDATTLIAAACAHRVLLVLGSALAAAGTLETWPAAFRDRCRSAERSAVVLECARHGELSSVLDALSAAGVRTLLIKGAALAYTWYPAPHLRVRSDTDLLIDAGDIATTQAVFAELGYASHVETSGRLVSYQVHFTRQDRFGIAHAFDVHWKISDRQALADALSFDELWSGRIAVPAVGPAAAAASPPHALLIALLHRAGHHPGSEDLLWLYDVHLLAAGLSEEERQQFVGMAVSRGHDEIAVEGLQLACRRYRSPATIALANAIEALSGNVASRRWRRPSSLVDMLQLDLRALPTWRARTSLLREHLLPPRHYMRQKYGIESTLLLPFFYVWRILAGAPAWFRRIAPQTSSPRT
jgi:hypothetical protein